MLIFSNLKFNLTLVKIYSYMKFIPNQKEIGLL